MLAQVVVLYTFRRVRRIEIISFGKGTEALFIVLRIERKLKVEVPQK